MSSVIYMNRVEALHEAHDDAVASVGASSETTFRALVEAVEARIRALENAKGITGPQRQGIPSWERRTQVLVLAARDCVVSRLEIQGLLETTSRAYRLYCLILKHNKGIVP